MDTTRSRLFAMCLCCILASHGYSKTVVGSIPGTLSVSLAGSANYAMPIKVAPGSAGTQPQIQLSYDTQSLGGSLGAGWNVIGLSAITRGPRDAFVDGRPQGIRLDDADALYLDGQRIVPIAAPSGSGDSRQIEYRKVNDDFTQIHQYGPDLNHSYFRVRTKGGLTIWFGTLPLIASATNPDAENGDATVRLANGAAIAFAESYMFDSVGNFIRYRYISNGLGDYNISEIDYTGHGSLSARGPLTTTRLPYASVSFIYEDAPRSQELYVAGQLVRKDKRLTDVYACTYSSEFHGSQSCAAASPTGVERKQAAHYKFHYLDSTTASRFLLNKIQMFGSDETSELPPTQFTYTAPSPGWINSPFQLPSALVLADSEKIGSAYRFVHFSPGGAGGSDLLFSAQIAGKKIAYAFKNNGPDSWTLGGTPWTLVSSGDIDFSPPVPFVNGEGSDLGVLLIDVLGAGRTAIIQNNVTGNLASTAAFLAGDKKFEPHDEYRVPFVVSRDGQIVSNYKLAHWTNAQGPDLLYESEGKKGFLRNAGVGQGWVPDDRYASPIELDSNSYLVDFKCKGDQPYLVGTSKDPGGHIGWRVFRFGNSGWEEELSDKFKPPFPATTNPEALRSLRLAFSQTTCSGMIVASAQDQKLHASYEATPTGWREMVGKAPPFDLVDANGIPSRAFVANLKGTNYPGVLANSTLASGSTIRFAYTQDSLGWHDVSATFVPGTTLATDDSAHPVNVFVGALVNAGTDDVVVLNDARPLSGDAPAERYEKFGRIFTNDKSQFTEQTDFAPPVAFARQDKQDLGVRFVDLHGTGLPDVVFSRLVTKDGKTSLIAGAYRNTGAGWVAEPGLCSSDSFDISNATPPIVGGLCPPIPFAGDDITGDPVQFVDLDGDGYLDLVYSYKNKAQKLITKIYFNADDGKGGRIWTERSPDVTGAKHFAPPDAIFPLASYGIGDMGVRFAKFDNNRIGVLMSFRSQPVNSCDPLRIPSCILKPGPLSAGAFSFDGVNWIERADFKPPVPFVTQRDLASTYSADLFVQVIDVNGSGLPAIVASFVDPTTNQNINAVWLNTDHGWDNSAHITVPYALDALYREPKTLLQFSDVNGDGIPDLVMTKGACANCSRTWLGTGIGWIESPIWRIPDEAIGAKDGDPGFRLVDTKGDGYLDVVWIRQNDDGITIAKGLRLNNGNDWSTSVSNAFVPDLPFVDKDGVDQGVRLLSVTGKGLTDIVSSFASRAQAVQLSRSRRADLVNSLTDGYGLTTSIFYESLLEVDGADPESHLSDNGPLGWRPYERGPPDAYPKLAPIPTTYIVRKISIDEHSGPPAIIDYRYGMYRVDGSALRSLGFGWRESLNEVSGVLTRSEMLQDVTAPGGVSREATCIVHSNVLKDLSRRDPASALHTQQFPLDLCPTGDQTSFTWGYKVSENATCWTVFEGDLSGTINEIQEPRSTSCGSDVIRGALTGSRFRQSSISAATSKTFEIDGLITYSSRSSFKYQQSDSLLNRHGNVAATVTILSDGSSTETTNEYKDDASRWFLGRLMKTTVIKHGDLLDGGTTKRKSETQCSSFDYAPDTGLITTQTLRCENARYQTTTKFGRDDSGNIISRTISSPNEQPQKMRSEFDKWGRLEMHSYDVYNHETAVERDFATGQPISITDPNNLVELYRYDTFGRLREKTGPTGIVVATELVAASAGMLPKIDARSDIASKATAPVSYAIRSQVGSLPPMWSLFDIKGREVRDVSQGFADNGSSRLIFKDAEYDGMGRITRASLPHDALSPAKWTSSTYDEIGRVCASIAINGLRTETIYEGVAGGGARIVVVVDPNQQLTDSRADGTGRPLLACGRVFPQTAYKGTGLNQKSSSKLNARKELVESRDALGASTYSYDAGGRLETIVGPTKARTHYQYDERGNRSLVQDPDLGEWHYEYDAFGRVVHQIDAKGQESRMTYDLGGRPKTRVMPDATTSWEYDTDHGVGKLASVSNSNGYKESFVYDVYGRAVTDAIVINGEQFVTSSEFDALGRITKMTYPSSLSVRNRYDENGFFVEVTDSTSGKSYWLAKSIDSMGRITGETVGNGITTIKQFNNGDERLGRIASTGANTSMVLDLTLDYDLIGNLKGRSERVEKKDERFEYDVLNRVVAQSDPAVGRLTLRYDEAGRIDYKSDVGDYHYAPAQSGVDTPFHAVQSTNYGAFTSKYKYDLNGNMISAPAGHLDYTSDNHLKSVYLKADRWVSFNYGPNGNRFREVMTDGNVSQETLFVGFFERVREYLQPVTFEALDAIQPARFTRSRNYLINGEGAFAVIETDETPANTAATDPFQRKPWLGKLTTQEVWYLHKDQLGSVLRVTDQDGRIRKRFWYDAWGARQQKTFDVPGPGEKQTLGSSWTRGFIGQEHLDPFSLLHMNGRVYNPSLAVFTSVDPVNQMIGDTQSGNGYTYARNNPLRYVDPSGMDIFGIGHFIGEVGKAIGGAATAVWHGITHFAGEAAKWVSENWRAVVVVAVVIIVTYVTLGSGTAEAITLGDAILAGAAAGAAGGAVSTALYGGSPDEIILAAIKGAIIGAVTAAAFYGVGSYFGPVDKMSATSQAEAMAAHGVVGGAKEAMEGGDFWRGFIATAATKASSMYGPDFHNLAADTARAAVVGGTVAELDGGKFANGAILGAFSYAFNDYAHKYAAYGAAGGAAIAAGGSLVVDVATGGVNVLATPAEVAEGASLGFGFGYAIGSLLDAYSDNGGPPDFDFYDPTRPPSRPGGQEWEWRGEQPVGGPKGGWANPDETQGRESAKPHLGDGGGHGPHWDWNDCRGGKFRCYPDGRVEEK